MQLDHDATAPDTTSDVPRWELPGPRRATRLRNQARAWRPVGAGLVALITTGIALGSDFDGDGRDDLAIGSSKEDIDGFESVGAVNVLFGSSAGITADGDLFISLGPGGLDGALAPFQGLGAHVLGADFNGDGFSDLAIGAPGESANGVASAGVVHVVYGSATGPLLSQQQSWHRDTPGVSGSARAFARFGYVMAEGDFDGDGFGDLAVGAPTDEVNGKPEAGSVSIFYGSPIGLSAISDKMISQETSGVEGTAQTGDRFSTALAAGDFDSDGIDDLAVGIPGEKINGIERAGAVAILYGKPSGLSASGDQLFHQGSAQMLEEPEIEDRFGLALAAGDFDGDGHEDLAVGVPFEDLGDTVDAGQIQVLYGSAAGLSAQGNQAFSQSSSGVASSPDDFELFGAPMMAGDFDGDGRSDLAVAAPYETVSSQAEAGSVTVLYGTPSGTTGAGSLRITRATSGVMGNPVLGENFGHRFWVGDYDGDGLQELAICAPGATVSGVIRAGVVVIFRGSTEGVSLNGEKEWSQATAGVLDGPELLDQFGYAFYEN